MINVNEYFKRIGLSQDISITHSQALLRELQYNHVISVPYENLDILNGRPLSLDIPDLFDKIVTQNRGGYCFEVNALFAALLTQLGFTVTNYFARYLRGETSLPMRRHRVLAVEADEGTFICDVGIGETAPRYPLLLEEGLIQEQGTETYKFERDPLLGWVLWEIYHGQWREYFSFTEDVAHEIDFVQPSFFCEAHSDSPFNKSPMVAIKTPCGRKSLNAREYKEFCGDKLVDIEENCNDERISELLKNHFGITWTPIKAFW